MTITNSGGAPAADAQRQKYDAMARDFATNASGAYTIQFELVCEPASIAKALKAGGSSVWFIPTSFRGRSCYRVFWGRYDTKAAADAAVGQIPASLREGAAVVIRTPKG
jgi:septal ring-binding cell division protein DamX